METTHFDLRLSTYYSLETKFYTFVLGVAAACLLLEYILLALIPLLITLAIFTADYGLEVNGESKTKRIYTRIFGVKFGQYRKYEALEYIFITSNKYSQKLNYRSISSTVRFKEYCGYLKFDEDNTMKLLGTQNKEMLLKKLNIIAAALGLEIHDRSGGR